MVRAFAKRRALLESCNPQFRTGCAWEMRQDGKLTLKMQRIEGKENMNIVRFEHQGQNVWGSLHGDVISVLSGDIFNGVRELNDKVSLQAVKLLAPVQPPKIIGIGLNYK